MSNQTPEPPTDPEDLIEQIRRYKYGIGANLEGDGRVVFENMRQLCQNLLATIAEDLNSKESHFILELLQNADDNSYAQDVDPSLTFNLLPEQLVVVNNEVGFNQANVAALCSAGNSSKTNKSGYIGEKGIGFKSVFKVTDAPEVHSNGYHFQFDRSNPEELLGYVVPHWKTPTVPVADDVTTLVLPARPGKPFPNELLNDLNATLLLFLKQLRRLTVNSATATIEYVREDSGPITTLTTAQSGGQSPTQSRFFRTSTTCDMSSLSEPKREKVKSTELVLAFPLSADLKAAPDASSPTYAFLPIREFGFPFCIQADFVLISSREGVHEDLDWNVTLRDAVAGAFVEALEKFKAVPDLANTYLSFLPVAADVPDRFFRHVVDQIVAALKQADCVPVEGGQWRRPEQVIVASPEARALFSAADALMIFGAEYPDTNFEATHGQLSLIGCRTLTPADVVAVFNGHAEWLAKKSTDWKARLFAFLAAPSTRAKFGKEMKVVACLPVAAGGFVSPQSGTVFYPLGKEKTYGFEHELTILDEDIFETAQALSADVKLLFDGLGVREDNPFDLVHAHILKRHAQRPLDSNLKALVGHVRYICDKLEPYLTLAVKAGQTQDVALATLKSGLVIGTKKEGETWFFAPAGMLYLGKSYRPEFDIETLLGDKIDLAQLVSDAYLSKKRGGKGKEGVERELESWRQFFYRIGVNESPLLAGGAEARCSPELEELLASEDSSVRRATLECFDRHWHRYEGSLNHATVSGRKVYNFFTPFRQELRATNAPTRKHATVPLDQAYLDNQAVRDALGGDLVFVNADLKNAKFLDAAGITHKVDAAACLKRLRQIRDGESSATRDQVKAIYRELERLWRTEQAIIEEAFATERLILVGSGESRTWVRPKDACWQATNVKFLDAKHPPLRVPYAEHQTFFTKKLSVPQELLLSKWVDALPSLSGVESLEERKSEALTIYRRLSRELGAETKPGQSWLQRFATEPLLLTHRGSLVPNSTALYAVDDPSYAELFVNEATISFLAITHDQFPSVANLIRRADVRPISAALSNTPTGETDGKPDRALTQKVRDYFGHIARIVYSQSNERFEAAIKEGLFERLRQLKVVCVPSLQLEVALGGVKRTTTGDAVPFEGRLLLREGAPSHVDHLAEEIQRILRLHQSQVATFSVLLRLADMKEADDYLQKCKTSRLPDDKQALLDGIETATKSEDENQTSGQEETSSSAARAADSAAKQPDEIAPLSDISSKDVPEKFGGGTPKSSAHSSALQPTGLPKVPAPASELISSNASRAAPPPTATLPRSPSPEGNAIGADREAPSVRQSPLASSPPIATADSSKRSRRRSRTESARPHKKTRTGRMLSHADSARTNDDGVAEEGERDPELAKKNKVVEEAAVTHFMKTAAGQWKDIRVMENPNNPGFDILATAHDGTEEFIEVKGQSGPWTEIGVGLTPTELIKACEQRERYWLCVVEYATDENRRQLHLVNNPFGTTDQFRFDKGWKGKATTVAARPTRPAVGLFVTITGKGKALIEAVRGKGTLMRLDVRCADDERKHGLLFRPDTMHLSVD
jgi:hypothetical protein